MVGYFENGKTISGAYYAALLDRFKDEGKTAKIGTQIQKSKLAPGRSSVPQIDCRNDKL